MSSTPTPTPTPAISAQTQQKFTQWNAKLGIPIEKLTAIHKSIIAKLKVLPSTAGKDDAFYDQRARRLMATKFATDLAVKAESFLGIYAMDGGAVDTNARNMDTAREMYANPQTRQEAIDSGLCMPDGTPLDTRQWFTKPNPDAGIRGRKNPNYKKPLKPFVQRRMIGFGRKMKDKTGMRLLVSTFRGEQAKLAIPMLSPIKVRMNIRKSTDFIYGLTSSQKSKIEAAPGFPEFEGWDQAKVLDMLVKAPPFNVESGKGVKTTIFNLDEFHNANKTNPFRACVMEADIITMDDEPTVTGNYRLVIGDVEADVDAPSKTCFVPADVYDTIKHLGLGSRCIFVCNTSLGTDMNTGERTQVNLNAIGILVKYAVSKEESLLEIGDDVEYKEA